MLNGSFEIFEKKVIIRIHDRICETTDEFLSSDIFLNVLKRGMDELAIRNPFLLNIFGKKYIQENDIDSLMRFSREIFLSGK